MQIKQKIVSVKNTIVANKKVILYSTAVGITTGIVLNKVALHSHDAFLKEHDLYDEYYTPDMDS